MLKVFYVNFNALVDPGATLSFVTHVESRKFDVLPDIFIEPF